jgi:hypothetical protein
LEHPLYSPNWSVPDFFLFPLLRCVLEGQRFASAEEVTRKATKALTELSKNCFHECFRKLYERWQKLATAQRNSFGGNIMEIDVRLFIRV